MSLDGSLSPKEMMVAQKTLSYTIRRSTENYTKLAKAKRSEVAARSRFNILKENWDKCQRYDAKLNVAADAVLAEDEYFTSGFFNKAAEAFELASDFYMDILETFNPGKVSTEDLTLKNVRATPSLSFKLPQINLPKFSGDFQSLGKLS